MGKLELCGWSLQVEILAPGKVSWGCVVVIAIEIFGRQKVLLLAARNLMSSVACNKIKNLWTY